MTQSITLTKEIKMIKKALKLDYLYSDRELQHMKRELRAAEETLTNYRREQKGGFGY